MPNEMRNDNYRRLQDYVHELEYKYNQCVFEMSKKLKSFNNGWINVEYNTPPIKEHGFSEHVLVYTNTHLITIGFYNHRRKENIFTWEQINSPKSFEELGYTVTHWMIFPEIPLI